MPRALIRRSKRGKNQRINARDWEIVKAQYVGGASLRTISRSLKIPLRTLATRSSREQWETQRNKTQQLAKRLETPEHRASVATQLTMQEKGENHVKSMSQIVDKAVNYAKTRQPAYILAKISQISELDKVGRRAYGLQDSDKQSQVNIQLNVNALRPPFEDVTQ